MNIALCILSERECNYSLVRALILQIFDLLMCWYTGHWQWLLNSPLRNTPIFAMSIITIGNKKGLVLITKWSRVYLRGRMTSRPHNIPARRHVGASCEELHSVEAMKLAHRQYYSLSIVDSLHSHINLMSIYNIYGLCLVFWCEGAFSSDSVRHAPSTSSTVI